MKIIVTTLFSFLLFVGAASAQHFNIGVKGGLNGYTITYGSVLDSDLKIDWHLGLIGHAHLSERFALQPELVYSRQGSKSIDLNYVNIPLLFQYMYNNGFRLQAGPQLGILVSAKTQENDATDDYQSIDLGIGVGVSYVNPATDFGVDFRYNHGLSNINIDNTNTFNRGFQVGVFYLFNHN